MAKIALLGLGKVGRAIAYDLSKEHNVVGFDNNPLALKEIADFINIETRDLDISDSLSLNESIKDFDLVVSAVPGNIGYQTLKTIIEAGKNCVDISFFPEDPLDLNELAEKNKVSVVVDAGVAPGLSNMVLGYHAGYMKVHSYNCYVGGLPFERKMPFQYKAPFSPIDVIEEYTRQVRYRVAGQDKVVEALTELELLHFDAVGTLEAFNTDGLRTLLVSYPDIRYMKEKTLRYPGHADLISAFKDSGFFSKEELSVNGKKVIPLELSSQLLFEKWKLDENDHEFTVMRIMVDGEGKDEGKKFKYDLFDITDQQSGLSSMARTTGFTASSVALLMLNGGLKNAGVITPEEMAEKADNFKFVVDHLEERGIILEVEQV
jgi:saccharopine dehydrogenase-like NADP-dependent oxidoreductase